MFILCDKCLTMLLPKRTAGVRRPSGRATGAPVGTPLAVTGGIGAPSLRSGKSAFILRSNFSFKDPFKLPNGSFKLFLCLRAKLEAQTLACEVNRRS